LDPVKKEAIGVKIFKVKNGDLRTIINAKSANFIKNYWVLNNIEIIHKPVVTKKGAKLVKKYFKKYKTLKEFKPKIIENLYEGTSNFSVIDAMLAIKLFLSQNVNIEKIKASLFALLIFPFFAPLFNLILFYYMPISNRFFNLALVSSIFIFVSLISWGILFMLIKISMNAAVNPELGIVLPIVILSLFAIYLHYKNR
jgi:lipopolysaccharide export system permease protein